MISLEDLRSMDGRCCWCGENVPNGLGTREHLIPKSNGGQNHRINLALACRPCNSNRGNRAGPPPRLGGFGGGIAAQWWREHGSLDGFIEARRSAWAEYDTRLARRSAWAEYDTRLAKIRAQKSAAARRWWRGREPQPADPLARKPDLSRWLQLRLQQGKKG